MRAILHTFKFFWWKTESEIHSYWRKGYHEGHEEHKAIEAAQAFCSRSRNTYHKLPVSNSHLFPPLSIIVTLRCSHIKNCVLLFSFSYISHTNKVSLIRLTCLITVLTKKILSNCWIDCISLYESKSVRRFHQLLSWLW